jgi:hypothetical protein
MFQVLHISFRSNIFISYSVVSALYFVSINPTDRPLNEHNEVYLDGWSTSKGHAIAQAVGRWPGFEPRCGKWDLWWTKWRWSWFSQDTSFSAASFHSHHNLPRETPRYWWATWPMWRHGYITAAISAISTLATPFTYLLMELSASWEAANCAASQELPSVLWNPKVHYRLHKSPPPVLILSQIDPNPTIRSYLSKIHFNIVHPPTSWSSQWGIYDYN